MQRWFRIAAGVVVAILVVLGVALFTPLADPDLSSHAHPAATYADAANRIDAVKATEAQQDLIPEAASIAMLTGSRTETAVVIFHGYTSVPRQFRLIAEGYRAQGYNVWVPRLPYHGETDRMTSDFSKLNAQNLRDFGDDNIDIARGLGKHVVVIGFSGGGALGTWASAARPDVSQTILISPVLHPLGIPEWADRPLVRALRLSPVDVYKWWNAEKKADNLEGYNYPRLSLKGLAGFLSLSHWVDAKAARGPVARMPILLVRNDGDQRLDSAYNERYVQRMTAPQMLSIYRIPKSAGLLHNFVSPESFSESHDHIREAYGYLSDVLGVPLPDPLAPR